MKKTLLFIALSLAILFLFVSCENAAGNGYIPNALGNTKVTLVIDNHHTSRTILPDDWTDEKKEELSYHLVATNLMYTDEVVEKDYTWGDFNEGKLVLELAASRWSFELTASKAGKIILSGFTVADLRNGEQAIPFDLKPVGTEKGSVDVTLTYTKPADYPEIVDHITVGLYNKESDFEGDTEIVDNPATIQNAGTDTPHVLFDKSVAPGKYYYIARFYNAENTLLMPYIEEVYVDPGNTSTKKIVLGDVINTPPKAPTEFEVTYLSNTLGTVQVEFKWRDNAINETGFVLEVQEYSDPTTPVGDPVIYDENSKFDDIDEYIDGNLIARADSSAPTFSINLKTGTLYKAKIKAVNEFGESEYCDYENADSEDFINLAVIAMHLNGGTVKVPESAEFTGDVFYGPAKDPVPGNYADETIYSYTYSISRTYVLPKSIDEDPTNYIKKDGFIFGGWYHMIENGEDNAGQLDYPITDGDPDTAITEYATRTYQNDAVYALWKSQASIEVVFPQYADKEFLITPDGETFYKDVEVGTPIVFEGPAAIGEAEVNSWIWTVDGVVKSTAQSWTYTTEGTETEAKNHVVMLTIEDITGQTYSNTVYIRVRNTVTAP
ncbi:MAG: hypothetical protein E7064_01145 [Spirochaetaceae bacterium]|nr:hypothetical protein [Spirochaetaceae bacterium]